MKELIVKTIASFLAALVLLSTISWTVDKHLCMGRVMDVALFSGAEDCGMESAMQAFCDIENHCCDNESFTLQGQDDLKLNFNDFKVDHQIFLLACTFSYFDLLLNIKECPVPDQIYPPPLLVQDYTVLYEVYLI